MKRIDIHECHAILLSIAAEFDRICRKHHIPYYMLGGTMLGAVRHRGFIPWDDDMDFGVPRAHYARLTAALAGELPAHMRVLTLRNGGFTVANFIKIDDSRTRISDRWLDRSTDMGVNIDVFPLDDGMRTGFQTRLFVSYIMCLLTVKDVACIKPEKRRGAKKHLARLFRFLFPLRTTRLLEYIDRYIVRHSAPDSEFMINFYGRWKAKEVVAKKIFGAPKAFEFGGRTFCGVENADAYLARLYGDYMQLPPESGQIVHTTEMYMKNDTEK
ncbi:MAG: LicD family protein [Tannerella sp.]|jgi:lipopolysaccharide cholinephosphotransferase|nr:LicD family protein [Tannerella sp.]